MGVSFPMTPLMIFPSLYYFKTPVIVFIFRNLFSCSIVGLLRTGSVTCICFIPFAQLIGIVFQSKPHVFFLYYSLPSSSLLGTEYLVIYR